MATQTETRHAGEFLISEMNGYGSREEVTILSGQNLAAGSILGKITSGGKYKAYDNALSDGAQSAAGILYDAVDASGGDKIAAVIVRNAEVDGDVINWGAMTGGDITAGVADLLTLGIIVR